MSHNSAVILDNPLGLALDVAAGHVYWADHNSRKIQRANLDGTNVVDILSDLSPHPSFIALDIVPEPATLCLLGLGVLLLRRRRC